MKKVEVTIDIETTPGRIIQAFTDSNMLRDWWGVERSLIRETKWWRLCCRVEYYR